MSSEPLSIARYACFTFAVLLVAFGVLDPVVAQGHGEDWKPTSEFEGKWDWIQMTSGEWVKGEIIAMYHDTLEFDSDEFDDLSLDWADIKTVHSSQIMNVGLLRQRSARGLLVVEGGKVFVIDGDEVQEFTKREVLTIAAGEPKEINFWSMKVFFGLLLRSGNSDVREANVQANFKRRTIKNRVTIDFVGNQNVTEGETVANNQRGSAGWDKFISDRFFVNPVYGEYFRDPFQNIAYRNTLGVGVGYQLVDSPKVDWQLSGGPAYQKTHFYSVAPDEPSSEDTPAMLLHTSAEWDISSWIEFDGLYRLQIVNEESGSYNHHLLISFETELTKWIDFDVSWIWDRIEDPRPDSDGVVPKQNDFRTTAGLTFEF